ncbi:MAG TPA: CRISPR-associated protein Cas4 [Anaerolineales bacterium]|nr:CRISPR-associated protein Cas4 [Anaerolineales bacterium]
MTTELTDYLPISMLNQLEYCERRFYLMHVLGEMEVNVHVLEGTLRHETVHAGGDEQQGDTLRHRRVYLWSDSLRIAGYCDMVEEILSPGAEGRTELIPVEYKKGRMGRWLNDHIQLCAQALCLEERSGRSVERGYLFYFGSRRREEVRFTPELRARTMTSIQRAHELARAERIPSPLENDNKCRDCSLEPVCLPREVKILVGTP